MFVFWLHKAFFYGFSFLKILHYQEGKLPESKQTFTAQNVH